MVSLKFLPVILGPEMAAPFLWAPGIFGLFLLENPHAHKIPPFRGGFWVFFSRGGGSANLIFMGAGIFPIKSKCIFLQNYFLFEFRDVIVIRGFFVGGRGNTYDAIQINPPCRRARTRHRSRQP